MLLDTLAVLVCLFAFGMHLRHAAKVLGLNRGARRYLLANLAMSVIPIALWISLLLNGVTYKYVTALDVTFCRVLYPLHFLSVSREALGDWSGAWVFAGTVVMVWILGFLVIPKFKKEALADHDILCHSRNTENT